MENREDKPNSREALNNSIARQEKSTPFDAMPLLFYETLFHHSGVAIAIADAQRMVIEVNEAIEELCGYSREEVIGKMSWAAFVAPEDLPGLIESAAKRRGGDEELSPVYEFRIKRKDGVLRNILMHTKMVPNTEYSMHSLIDITELRAAQDALDKSERKFRSIFEQSLDGVKLIDEDGILIEWNAAMEEMTGLPRSEVLGKYLWDVQSRMAPPSIRSAVFSEQLKLKARSLIANEFLDRNQALREATIIHADGSEHTLQTQVYAIETGSRRLFAGFSRDVTALKRGELEVIKLSRAISQSPVSILITDQHGSIEYVNPKFTQLTGFTLEECIGKTPGILKSGYTSQEEYLHMFNTLHEGHEWTGVFLNKRKNGELFWEEVSISPLRNKYGATTHYVAVKIDITRKKWEEHRQKVMRYAREKFSLAHNSHDISLVLTEAADDLLQWGYLSFLFYDSASEVFRKVFCTGTEGTLECDASTKDCIQIDTELTKRLHADRIQQFTTSEDKKNFFQCISMSAEGNKTVLAGSLYERDKLIGIIALLSSDDEMYGDSDLALFGELLDATSTALYRLRGDEMMRIALARAEDSNRLKESLLANMSHEFRTPMNGILGFADILYEELDSPELKQMARDISRAGERLMNTLNSIMELAVLESNTNTVSLKTVPIAQMVLAIFQEVRRGAERNDLEFTCAIENVDVLVSIDARLLRRTILILLSNAFKFTQHGGVHIRLWETVQEEGRVVSISIEDTGIGIPIEYQEIIFQEFRQVSEGIGRSYEGSGLGLTLAHKMVMLMGGTIIVRSEMQKGSTFTLTFPSIQPEEETEPVKKQEPVLPKKHAAPPPEPAEKPHARKSLPKLLVIEDNEMNIQVIEHFLKSRAVITSATDGLTGLEILGRHMFDVILLDINLGESINGIEVLKQIRANPLWDNIPVIAVTGYSLLGDKERLLQEGFDNYIAKPFERKELLSKLECYGVLQ